MKTTLEKSIKEIVQQASEYLPEDIEFGLVRELEKRELAAVNTKLQEAVEKIKKLHSESKKLERREGSTGFIEFGKTNAYRNSLLIIESLQINTTKDPTQ